MSYSTLITGPERRRRWSEEQKLELLAEAFGPGGSVTETARRADIHTSLLYRWRRATLTPPPATSCFTPAVLIAAPDEPPEPQRAAGPSILVELPGGARVHVMADAPADLVATTLRALR
jgi:transposase